MSPDSKDGNEIARSNTLPTSDASERKKMAFHAYPHAEKHTEHGLVVRDTIIGFADGLTVPFALTAGLSRLVPSNLSLNISSLAKHVKFIGTLAYDPSALVHPALSSSAVSPSSSPALSLWVLVAIWQP